MEKREQERSKKNRARVVFWAVAFLVIVGTVFGMVKLASRAPNGGSDKSIASTITEADQVKGNRSASTTLIEFSDFQCPACASYAPMVKRVAEEFGNQLAIAYRHFPLPQHKNAPLAAQAAEAAGKQGKFWEMHDKIFANQREWAESSNARAAFTRYAEFLGLNMEKFNADIDSQEIKNKIDSDYESGQRIGIGGTPTFFLDGQHIQNPRNYESFKSLITDAIDKNS